MAHKALDYSNSRNIPHFYTLLFLYEELKYITITSLMFL